MTAAGTLARSARPARVGTGRIRTAGRAAASTVGRPAALVRTAGVGAARMTAAGTLTRSARAAPVGTGRVGAAGLAIASTAVGRRGA